MNAEMCQTLEVNDTDTETIEVGGYSFTISTDRWGTSAYCRIEGESFEGLVRIGDRETWVDIELHWHSQVGSVAQTMEVANGLTWDQVGRFERRQFDFTPDRGAALAELVAAADAYKAQVVAALAAL